MKHRKRKHNIYFIIIFFLCVSISVGYSYLNTTLNIKGSTSVSKNTWDVHFENIQVTSGSITATTEPTISSDTNITFQASLIEQGDFYEFTVDVVNAGTIDAMLNALTLTNLTTEQQEYLEFSATYSDGETIEEKDSLPAGYTDKIKVAVKYKSGLTSEQLPTTDQNITLSLKTTYVQKEGTVNERPPTLLSIMQANAKSDSSIDFSKISSSSNGRGIYMKSTDNKIYYYRGAVTNNNVLFANFCWKIVRSTDTGGIKLVYNGPPSNGQCTNTKGDNTHIGTATYNSNYTSPADLGYMYGSRYTSKTKDMSSSTGWKYGKTVTYADGTYTLSSTYTSTSGWATDHSTIGKTYHYTCFSSKTTCTTINYIYYSGDSSTAYYVQLSGGKKIADAVSAMNKNTNDSNAKKTIESWYASNMTNYTSRLEDHTWCNDRSISSGGWTESGNANGYLYYAASNRGSAPILSCPNNNDKFTVASGNLKYPVGLLTSDEVVMAGAVAGQDTSNNTFYLDNNCDNYFMTPYFYTPGKAYIFAMYPSGKLMYDFPNLTTYVLRPSIVLKSQTKVEVGTTGTSTNPYIVVLD